MENSNVWESPAQKKSTKWGDEQAQTEQWNCNIKDLNVHSFIGVILLSAEFHGNDLIIRQPKLSHM